MTQVLLQRSDVGRLREVNPRHKKLSFRGKVFLAAAAACAAFWAALVALLMGVVRP